MLHERPADAIVAVFAGVVVDTVAAGGDVHGAGHYRSRRISTARPKQNKAAARNTAPIGSRRPVQLGADLDVCVHCAAQHLPGHFKF